MNSIRLTLFSNFAAQSKCEREIGLPQMVDLIRTRSATVKDRLPWLKLARFGSVKTTHRSLRHDANVLAVTGIEADYDAHEIDFSAAIDTVRSAGVLAVVYTSPSHTEDTPRWRVLSPLSAELPPAERARQVSRLNGLFGGGAFARESWTLSQAYFFGMVGQNPSHQVELIHGTPIDMVAGLDATAIGPPRPAPAPEKTLLRPAQGASAAANDAALMNRRPDGFRDAILETLRRQATPGNKHYALLRYSAALGGILKAGGWTKEEAVNWLVDALPQDEIRSRKAAKKTAEDGLAHGAESPITLDERVRA
jgi:hypothetical protein